MKKRIISIILSAMMVFSFMPTVSFANGSKAGEATLQETLKNPQIVTDASMTGSGQKVTWDCVWFGSYPQTEIVDKAETCGCYG